MCIKKVAKYETSDGKLFDDAVEAHNHELAVHLDKQIRLAYAVNVATGRVDSLITALLHDPMAMRDLLTKYIQKRKQQKEAA